MPRLILKWGEGHVETIELRPGRNRLGRARESDFPIEHPTVSATHCEIICQDETVLVRDCGSTNGTFINGHPIQESRLHPGETLHLGAVEMALEAAPVVVAIPHVDFREPPPPRLLADGTAPCLNHAEVPARRKCTQCQKCFCEACVHTLRRVGGRVLMLCPLCSGKCELISGKDVGKPKKRTFLGALRGLKKTLKISRKSNS